jgi:hypothetical protein
LRAQRQNPGVANDQSSAGNAHRFHCDVVCWRNGLALFDALLHATVWAGITGRDRPKGYAMKALRGAGAFLIAGAGALAAGGVAELAGGWG